MKISDSRPVGAASAPATAGVRRAHAGRAPAPAPADATSIMGIPEAEFTPKVRDAIMNLMHEVDRFRQELEGAKRRIEHLEKLAEHDTLVPILNRRGFVREMTKVKNYADRYNVPATLIFFDLNDFKPVNDSHGHAAGDAVLQKIAQVLVKNTRDSDVVGRLGGDEFGVILVNTPSDVATRKAKSLSDAVAELRFTTDGKEYSVSASYGAYSLVPGEDLTEALAKADAAMYASKRERKTV